MSSMDVSLIILCLVLFRFSNVCGYDYCSIEKKVCKNQQHIACHPQQMVCRYWKPGDCSFFRVLFPSREVSQFLMSLHIYMFYAMVYKRTEPFS